MDHKAKRIRRRKKKKFAKYRQRNMKTWLTSQIGKAKARADKEATNDDKAV